MTLVSPLSFPNLRFWKKLGKISVVFVNSVDRDLKLDAAKLLLNHQVEEVLVSSRALIKDFKTSQSIEVLNQGQVCFRNLLKLSSR